MSPAASGPPALPGVLADAGAGLPAPAGPGWLARLRGNTRLLLLLGAPALVAAIAAAMLYGRSPDYGVLYTQLSDKDGGAVISALQQMNVPYRFAAGGSTLMVPQAQVPELRLRLAQQGLPQGGTVGFELLDKQKFGTSQFAEQVNYQRGLEGELARSINAMGGVESSRVHLALPKPSLFVREQKKPSASIMLKLHRGRSLDEAQVSAIVHLVSSSVPDLSPRSVTVVDQSGQLLSGATGTGRGLDGGQLKYTREVEERTIQRIEAILQPLLGPGNAQAQVTADIDFATTERTDETYRPNQDGTAAVRSQQTSESGAQAGAIVGGVPGALSNQPPLNPTAPLVTPAPSAPARQAPSAAPGVGEAPQRQALANGRRDATINYEVDRSIRHTQQAGGTLRRLSVAVVVNYRPTPAAAPGASAAVPGPQALSAAELEQVQNLVKEAMGFNRERGDTLSVAHSPFAREAAPPQAAAPPVWRDPEVLDLARTGGLYALIGLLVLYTWFAIGRPLLRKHLAPPAPPAIAAAAPREERPAADPPGPAAETRQAQEARRQQENLDYAQQLAQQDPRTVAMLVNHWMTQK